MTARVIIRIIGGLLIAATIVSGAYLAYVAYLITEGSI